MINSDINYIILTIVIIFQLIIVSYVIMKNNKNKNDINKLKDDICDKKGLCNNDENFNYKIYRSNTYFGICPLNNTSNSTYLNINTNGKITCTFFNLKFSSVKFINSFINNINNCYFGYSNGTGLDNVFENCLFDNIQNTDFLKVHFYRKNLINNVFLTNVSFDQVKFDDHYYLFNIIDNVIMFSSCSFGDHTIFEITGKTPIYINVNANISEQMIPNNVYYFKGIGYVWNTINDKYTLTRLSYF